MGRNIQRTKSPRRDDQGNIVRNTSSGTHRQGHIARETSSGKHRQGNIVKEASSGTHCQGRIVLASSKTPQGKCPEIRLTEYKLQVILFTLSMSNTFYRASPPRNTTPSVGFTTFIRIFNVLKRVQC
jgi:hypothetical protein